MNVVVVGSGVAGTGAALAAARAGARVTLIDGGTGASTLATGAIDLMPWQDAAASKRELPAEARAAIDALGGYVLPPGGSRLLTTAGLVRPAAGHDAALLDIRPLVDKRIAVVRCDRPGWDADVLARAWGSAFTAVDATVLRHVDEQVIPDADFAARHDDEARLEWLAARLREAAAQDGSKIDALVLPPSLGIERARAHALSKLVGLPCGEAVALPGGPAGLRFEKARDRALSAAQVERVVARAMHVERGRVTTEDGVSIDADATVLAIGGLLGGGIEYAPSEGVLASALPPFARIPFRIALEVQVVLGLRGVRLELPGSLFGPAPEWLASQGAFDGVGVLADATGRAGCRIFVAGELLADAPRTWLWSLWTGVKAGAAAAQDAATSATAHAPLPAATPASRL